MVSFPFLFGVMFGDIMHGAILTCTGIWLIFSKREKGTLAHSLGPVRYLFFLMGVFAFYCGLIYNDFTSLPVMIADTCWDEDPQVNTK
jgi:V-type H+-transporting ATPase subunit a